MIDAQPEYQTITALVMAGELVAAEKRGERVAALLHRKHGVFFNLPHGQKSIAGRNQMFRIRIDRAKPLADLAGEEIVKASDMICLVILNPDIVCLNKRSD